MRPVTLLTDDELAREWLAAERIVNDPTDEDEQGFAILRQQEIEAVQAQRESAPDSTDPA